MSNKITLYGNQTIDYLLVSNYIPNEIQKTELRKPNIIPDWNTIEHPIINAPFTSDLVSSYISGMTSEIIGFEIYRMEESKKVFEKVATVDKDTFSLIDHFVANNTNYSWIVFPVTENEVGISMQSNFTKFCWWDWTVIGLDETKTNSNVYIANEIFKFSLNVQSEPELQNRDITIMQGLSQYPKESVGNQNYLTGGISAMLGHVMITKDGKDYIEPVSMKKEWYDFIGKGKPCLLKDRAGNMRKVSIQNDSTAKAMDELHKQPNVINFKWIERGSTEHMTVYEIPIQEEMDVIL